MEKIKPKIQRLESVEELGALMQGDVISVDLIGFPIAGYEKLIGLALLEGNSLIMRRNRDDVIRIVYLTNPDFSVIDGTLVQDKHDYYGWTGSIISSKSKIRFIKEEYISASKMLAKVGL